MTDTDVIRISREHGSKVRQDRNVSKLYQSLQTNRLTEVASSQRLALRVTYQTLNGTAAHTTRVTHKTDSTCG